MHDSIDVASTNFLSNLPENCITQTWKNFPLLRQAANEVFNLLQENDLAGNQFIVVHGLSKHAIEQFTNDENVQLLGGIKYRFALEGVVGVIKIVPSGGHERSTDDLMRMMDKVFLTMGFSSKANYSWAGATRHSGTVPNSEREPDQCLFPAALIQLWIDSMGGLHWCLKLVSVSPCHGSRQILVGGSEIQVE